jgi:hypothetical protein
MQGVTQLIDRLQPSTKTRAARVLSGRPALKNEGPLAYGSRVASPIDLRIKRRPTGM